MRYIDTSNIFIFFGYFVIYNLVSGYIFLACCKLISVYFTKSENCHKQCGSKILFTDLMLVSVPMHLFGPDARFGSNGPNWTLVKRKEGPVKIFYLGTR